MSDLKSKLPDLQEFIGIAGKFFKDMKTSISEIVDTYKQKRAEENAQSPDDENTDSQDKR